ncbi:MAG: cytidine deaminase [Myxococcales bacterium]|nr:cytidine deaminase [Myxococcales bacterium]
MKEDAAEKLIQTARDVRVHAYAPYSRFLVGAAVLAPSGKIYPGVNVENASYPAGICAERAAICAAITAGERSLLAVAVSTELESPAAPCGMCRQALAEFGPDMHVFLTGPAMESMVLNYRLSQLLPHQFGAAALNKEGSDRA